MTDEAIIMSTSLRKGAMGTGLTAAPSMSQRPLIWTGSKRGVEETVARMAMPIWPERKTTSSPVSPKALNRSGFFWLDTRDKGRMLLP